MLTTLFLLRWLTAHFGEGILHRAFSVFLFNEKNELMLQKRTKEKITFPSIWSNTCCSHPLFVQDEMEPGLGVKRAAIRKLEHELGIPTSTLETKDLRYVSTVLYKVQYIVLYLHLSLSVN